MLGSADSLFSGLDQVRTQTLGLSEFTLIMYWVTWVLRDSFPFKLEMN
jgi:hypothetical protein